MFIRDTTRGFLCPPPLIRMSRDPERSRQSVIQFYLTHRHIIPYMAARCAVKLMETRALQYACRQVMVKIGVVDLSSQLFSYVKVKVWFA